MRRWQRHDDPGFLLDDGGGQFDQVQPQRVELGFPPRGAFWTGRPHCPPQPVGAPVQHEPHLIGAGLRAGRAVGGEMALPALDVVLGLAARGVELFVEMLAARAHQIGHDEAGVASQGAHLDPGNDATGLSTTTGPRRRMS